MLAAPCAQRSARAAIVSLLPPIFTLPPLIFFDAAILLIIFYDYFFDIFRHYAADIFDFLR